MISFQALSIHEQVGEFVRKIEEKSISDLPDGDLLIRVAYSSLKYKDALSATGNKGVTRAYPHTPGIDAAGQIVESNDENWKVGDEVLVTEYDLGINTPGGFLANIFVYPNTGWSNFREDSWPKKVWPMAPLDLRRPYPSSICLKQA